MGEAEIIQIFSVHGENPESCGNFTPKPVNFRKGDYESCDFITEANKSVEIVALFL